LQQLATRTFSFFEYIKLFLVTQISIVVSGGFHASVAISSHVGVSLPTVATASADGGCGTAVCADRYTGAVSSWQHFFAVASL
jgi:hypothetical protein